MKKPREIGLGIIGSGRIGTLRARLAAGHPAVRNIVVSDLDPGNAEKLAKTVGGRSHGADNLAVIDDPDVTAVVVSTSEGEHLKPMLAAIARGKPVLVEKPIALTVREAEKRVAWAMRNLKEAQAIADSMRAKVLSDHSPAMFWGHVFSRLGMSGVPECFSLERTQQCRKASQGYSSHFGDVERCKFYGERFAA